MPKNLLRGEILPFGDCLQSTWFEKWSLLTSSEEADQFKQFITDKSCPEGVQELAREPLLLYLLAAMHRGKELQSGIFHGKSADQMKLQIYEKTLKWALEKQRDEELNYALTGQTTNALIDILAEAGLCAFHAGVEQVPLSMLVSRLKKSKAADLLQKNKLKNALATFYLQKVGSLNSEVPPTEWVGSVEFTHKSFGEFLCARKIAHSLIELSIPQTPQTDFDIGIYDLLGLRLLTPEVVGYLMAKLHEIDMTQRLSLFERLKIFYFCWQAGNFLDRAPTENLPQIRYLELKVLNVGTNLRATEVSSGLNVFLLLLQLRVQADSLVDGLTDEFAFNPCHLDRTNSDPTFFLRVINFADSVRVGLFRSGVGQFMQLADVSQTNLSGANLSGANLSGANLSNTNLSRANLSGAIFNGANLSGANLNGANLSNTNLSRANLSGAIFNGANLSSTNLSEANLREANLSGTDLCKTKLSGTDFIKADLSKTNLSGFDLSRATLEGANLEGANLREANLEGANLREANLEGGDLIRANLFGATLIRATLRGATLRGATLSEATLRGADLERADLEGATLREATLRGANLSEANLRGANLSEANLIGANLIGADLKGVTISDSTQFDPKWKRVYGVR
jgi:uncharacterized protein YjbI with pentapeptide repeats